jgi:transmembrane sensor
MTRASDITDAAADWLIRLEGRTSPETWDAFQAWLDRDPRHRATFIRLRAAWNYVDVLKNVRPADGTIDADLLTKSQITSKAVTSRGLEPLRGKPRRHDDGLAIPERRHLVAAAAAIGVIGLFTWVGISNDGWSSHETAVGIHQTIHLADGSGVDLNTNTDLRERISETRRDMVLLRGEALFHVTHDPGRPFYVSAGGTIVRAVGTAFSVRVHAEGQVDVLVAEGRVAVGAAGSAVNLNDSALLSSAPEVAEGESARVVNDSVAVSVLNAEEVKRRLAWIGGQLAFKGETIAQAVGEFNRYNQRQIIVDASLADLRVGGTFRATDLDSFIAALGLSFGIQPRTEGDTGNIRLIPAAPPSSQPASHASMHR